MNFFVRMIIARLIAIGYVVAYCAPYYILWHVFTLESIGNFLVFLLLGSILAKMTVLLWHVVIRDIDLVEELSSVLEEKKIV